MMHEQGDTRLTKTILIVEDDPAVALGLNDFVRGLGYRCLLARDGIQALALFAAEKPELILLDLVLPKKNGAEVCKEIRNRGDMTPIIMVTAKGQPQDRVRGLDLGADDYVTKPFNLHELAARIRAVLRRTDPVEEDVSVFHVGSVRIDLASFVIERAGTRYELSTRERDILSLLLKRRNQVVSRSEILDQVWGMDQYPSTRTVDNYIVAIRKKLEADPASPQVLLSVRSFGYKLVTD